eukprot:Hpha_TRINITY_DN30582_c0_g1::TRINITY_DN30582_c0_g1_i1::g.193773::m.193773
MVRRGTGSESPGHESAPGDLVGPHERPVWLSDLRRGWWCRRCGSINLVSISTCVSCGSANSCALQLRYERQFPVDPPFCSAVAAAWKEASPAPLKRRRRRSGGSSSTARARSNERRQSDESASGSRRRRKRRREKKKRKRRASSSPVPPSPARSEASSPRRGGPRFLLDVENTVYTVPLSYVSLTPKAALAAARGGKPEGEGKRRLKWCVTDRYQHRGGCRRDDCGHAHVVEAARKKVEAIIAAKGESDKEKPQTSGSRWGMRGQRSGGGLADDSDVNSCE